MLLLLLLFVDTDESIATLDAQVVDLATSEQARMARW